MCFIYSVSLNTAVQIFEHTNAMLLIKSTKFIQVSIQFSFDINSMDIEFFQNLELEYKLLVNLVTVMRFELISIVWENCIYCSGMARQLHNFVCVMNFCLIFMLNLKKTPPHSKYTTEMALYLICESLAAKTTVEVLKRLQMKTSRKYLLYLRYQKQSMMVSLSYNITPYA